MSEPNVKMLCESCQKEHEFEHEHEFPVPGAAHLAAPRSSRSDGAPRHDYVGIDCGWYQTSSEGGHCEVLTSWLTPVGDKGLPGFYDDPDLIGLYIYRTCQGPFGQHYANIFARTLLDALKREGIELGP